MTAYRGFNKETLEREYSPSSMIGGDYMPFIRRYIDDSAEARQMPGMREDIAYGADPAQVLDFFPGQISSPSGAPLHVFIHGGYWQELSHKESAPMASTVVADGRAFAAVNYRLAPEARIGDMVEDCASALCWLADHATELGFDAKRVTVSGSSAGAHLAAMLLHRADLAARDDVVITDTLLISGIYDLTPIRDTYINEPLKLTDEDIAALSPQFLTPALRPRCRVIVGAVETSEFIRQSRDYAAHLKTCGLDTNFAVIPDRNHFDIILDPAVFSGF